MNLICYFHKLNKFSFNALLGAAETLPFFAELNLILPQKPEQLMESVRDLVRGKQKTLLCFSFFSSQIWEIKRLIKEIRKTAGPEVLCLAGGAHASADPAGTLDLGFDLVACGEGEPVFQELLAALYEGRQLTGIEGLVCVSQRGEGSFSRRRPAHSLDAFAPFSEKASRFGPIEITRGCPFVCAYCQIPYLQGAQMRHRSVGSILKYVAIKFKRGLKDMRFITPNAFAYGSPDGRSLNLSALSELLTALRQLLGKKGKIYFGSFPSEVRPEQVTPETMALLREFADNTNLLFGAQSGSPRVLEKCRRGHNVDDVFRAAELTIAAGMRPNIDFIFGLPGEEAEDVRLSLEVIRELTRMGARIHAHTFMPLPKTSFAKAAPGEVTPAIRAELEILIGRGQAFGDWQAQQDQAEWLARYYKTGKLTGC